MPTELTEKQRRFVEAYMGAADGNATEAARRAGYKGNDATLATVAYENLRKHEVRAAIQERVETMRDVADRKERHRFWTGIMRGSGSMFDTRDRLRASELLAKAQGDFLPPGKPSDDDIFAVVRVGEPNE